MREEPKLRVSENKLLSYLNLGEKNYSIKSKDEKG
jgi:hypothetical protein